MPNGSDLAHLEEPITRCVIHVPSEHVGSVLKLCNERRGIQKELQYLSQTRVMVTYEIPLAELILTSSTS